MNATPRNAGPAGEVSAVPRHIAIIMDGNGRWAAKRRLPRVAGHRRGVANIQSVVHTLAERGVEVATLYAFSTENWRRPTTEVNALMEILAAEIEPQTRELHEAGVRLVHLGNPNPLDGMLQDAIAQAERITEGNDRFILNIAFNYGGRDEITPRRSTYPCRRRCPRRCGRGFVRTLPLHRRLPRPGPHHPHRWGAAAEQFSYLAGCIQRVLPYPGSVARPG